VVSALLPATGGTYVLVSTCDPGASRVYWLRNGTAHPLTGGPVGDLLAGPGRAWAVHYPGQGAAPDSPVVLRPLDGGRPVALPPNGWPVGDTGAGLIAAVGPADNGPPRLIVLDPHSGRPGRTLGVGWPLHAGADELLLEVGQCGQGLAAPSCTVARIDVHSGRLRGRYRLPDGRTPVSNGVVSRDGRLAAFQLARAKPDPRYDAEHPMPPSDVVVLHLDTGRLDTVPGLELAPKTSAGLAFGPDSRWLFATVSDGDHAHVLAWRSGLAGPRAVARLAGPLVFAPPVLIT
jgi:hypothetical protein